MNTKRIVSYRDVFTYAGAFIALLIGSGFATGQEIMQYFAAWGFWGMAGAVVCFALLAYVGVVFISCGYHREFEKPNDIYKYFCGPYLGTFYDYFSILFIYMSYIVMVGGASATGAQHYHWPNWLGGALLAGLAMLTVVFGLKRIVDVIGKIGPAIVVLSIIVAVGALWIHRGGISTADSYVKALRAAGEIKVASTNWLLAVGSYVGFCMLWLAAFLGQVGRGARSHRDGRAGAILGAGGFSLAVILMSLAILFAMPSIEGLNHSQIPNLILAGEIAPWLANVFSVVILLGIYTTAVPLLWNVIARFAEDRTKKFTIITAVLGVIGAVIGIFLEFDVLVNYVYVLNGYVGLALLCILFLRTILGKHKELREGAPVKKFSDGTEILPEE
ncbi:MAG: hypothetical protein Q4P08_00240 [Eubacteriales bacterium]|nr:hypothetical protein [Eubacteriales bacterium]